MPRPAPVTAIDLPSRYPLISVPLVSAVPKLPSVSRAAGYLTHVIEGGPNPGRLVGEVALVTGSTAGLGRVIAVRLAAEGADVVVTGRNAERGKAVADEVGGTFLAADLTDEVAATTLVDATAQRYGCLTVLVNNAVATVTSAPVDAVATEDWEATFRVNVTAAMWLCRAAIPHFRAAGHGAIVNVSSRAAERASPGLAAYVAAKGALNALTRSLAVDYADRRHPGQHRRPRLRAQRPPGRRPRRRRPGPTRSHAPHPSRHP